MSLFLGKHSESFVVCFFQDKLEPLHLFFARNALQLLEEVSNISGGPNL